MQICKDRQINIAADVSRTKEAKTIKADQKDLNILKELLILINLLKFMREKFEAFNEARQKINDRRNIEVSNMFYSAIDLASKEPAYKKMSAFGKKILEYEKTILAIKKELVSRKLSKQMAESFNEHITLFESIINNLKEAEEKKAMIKNQLQQSKPTYNDLEVSISAKQEDLVVAETEILLSTIGVLSLDISLPGVRFALGVTNGWVTHLSEIKRLVEFKSELQKQINIREATIKGNCQTLQKRFAKKEPVVAPPPTPVGPPKPTYSIPFSLGVKEGYIKALDNDGVSGLGTDIKADIAFAKDDWAVGIQYLGDMSFDVENGGNVTTGQDQLIGFGKYQTKKLGLLGQIVWENHGREAEEYDALGARLGYDQMVWNRLGVNARAELLGVVSGNRAAAGIFDGVLAAGLHWKEEVVIPFADVIVGYEHGAFDVGALAGVGLPFAEGHELNLAVSYRKEKGLSAMLHHSSRVHKNVELGARAVYSYDMSSHEVGGEAFAVFPIAKVAGQDMGLQVSFEGNSDKEIGGGLTLFWGRPITPSYLPTERPYSQEPFGEPF